MKRKDLTGQKFGRLTVTGFAFMKNRHSYWKCRCDCGNEITVCGSELGRQTNSCGCLIKEIMRKNTSAFKHGKTGGRLYRIWHHIKGRCLNKRDYSYKYYGARGIAICNEWLDFVPFYNWAVNNGYNDNLTIDRINNDGNYEPENCRWIDRTLQAKNRRFVKLFNIEGETLCVAEIARKYNIPRKTLANRIKKGWGLEKAITAPHKFYTNKLSAACAAPIKPAMDSSIARLSV
jgi:hypothetical protein